jgi:serine protease inhibitor
MEENKEDVMQTLEPTVINSNDSINEPVENIPTESVEIVNTTTPVDNSEPISEIGSVPGTNEVADTAAPGVETVPVVEPAVETPVENPQTEMPTEETPAPAPEQPAPEATDAPAVEPVQESAPKKKSKLPIILLILILLAAGGFAVWYFVLGGNGSKKEEEKKDDSTTTTTTESKTKASPYRLSGNSLEDFDLQFLKLENKKENVIYSPLSIKYALAMLNEGTDGESHKQIADLIGDYKGKKYTNSENLSLANALFIKDTFKDNIKNDYIESLKSKYNADVFTDPFQNPDQINNWVKENTLGLIDHLVDELPGSALFYLVNALGIDMDWDVPFTHYKDGGKPDGYTYLTSYAHEQFSWETSSTPVEGTFEGNDNKISTMEAEASFNNYDAVKVLGDKLTTSIRETYKGCFPDFTDERIDEMVKSTVESIDANYGREDKSTEFSIYYDDQVKVFAKDLKEYDGVTLQYLAIMPKTVGLDAFVKTVDAKSINNYIKGLKGLKKENFKDGYITKITGLMPKFTYDYTLALQEDLESLGVKDIFDGGKADLSKITGEKGAYIYEAIHKATIELTQYGIKAAAATGMGGAGNVESCPFYLTELPIEEIDMKFDKPFMYIIRDKDSGEVWFTGTVYNPLEWAKDPDYMG